MPSLGGIAALLLLVSVLHGQTLSNASLNGRFYYRQLEFSTDALGNVTGSVASLGTLILDGAGGYTVNAFEAVGNQSPTTLTGTGSYSVGSSGTMTLSNPQRNGYTINARMGTELILGSTTESGDNTFDLFAAIPAPATGTGATLLSGNYSSASFELQNSVASGVRSAIFNLPISTGGAIGNFNATGHAASYLNGAIQTLTVAGGSYAIGTDGVGTMSFGTASPIVGGTKNVYVSSSGNVFLAGSPYAGGQDMLIGIRQFSGTPALTNFNGLYWTGSIRLDLQHQSTSAYAGSLDSIPGLGQTVESDRLHQIGLSPGFEVTLSNTVSVASNSTFIHDLDLLLLGTGGNGFVAAGLSSLDTAGYSINIGIRAPSLTGTGIYLSPQGIFNGASLAPAGAAIAPGEYITVFGSGLASDTLAGTLPYTGKLGDTSVTVNNSAAPVAYVSANQVNFLVPYGATGSSASIVVTNGGTASNNVTVPLQNTAPGVFSVNGTGTGLGVIAHSSGALVTAANPARRGETVVVYAAGLGAVNSTVIDGSPAAGATSNSVAATIAGQTCSVTYSGLAPSFPGLYQISVFIPTNLVGSGALPLAIRTADSYHDQVDIQVQ